MRNEGPGDAMRTEEQIFADLAELCKRPGYAHVIAFFCLRDHLIAFGRELKAADFSNLTGDERVIRTELLTLIGLMARAPIDYSRPPPDTMQVLIERTQHLLNELHEVMAQPLKGEFESTLGNEDRQAPVLAFTAALAMREPIFYGGDSAYGFQYRDFAPKKYARDESWLTQNRGFTIEQARQVVLIVEDLLSSKMLALIGRQNRHLPYEDWNVLDGLSFSAKDVAARSRLPAELIDKVLSAFTFEENGNPTFSALNEFNATVARPLLRAPEDSFILFLVHNFEESLYESPFYWMAVDKGYVDTAMANRGAFTEEFAAERFTHVFGPDKVFKNVDIWQSKAKKIGEIDTLILFANRAILVQAKSKRLTLGARKGNDLQLKEDFKAAVQDACDQAHQCCQYLQSHRYLFTDENGQPIELPPSIKIIYPICLISDHFPALSYQVRQFLRYEATAEIAAPLVCDVFLLDATTEMLETPLRYLSYLDLRATIGDKLSSSHETIALGYHLKRNLWLGQYDFMLLNDEVAADLHAAMTVRREGVKGERTPPGILTQLQGTSVGRIIREIEKTPNAVAVDLGLQLLKLSGNEATFLSNAIDRIALMATKDSKSRDATIFIGDAGSGITAHCNDLPDPIAVSRLRRHCAIRKYSRKAANWFGLLLRPDDGALRAALVLDHLWAANAEMDKLVTNLPKGISLPDRMRFPSDGSKIKFGRNDPCPCGSGLKYKKCCLFKAGG